MLKVIKTFTSLNGATYRVGQEISPYEYRQLFDEEKILVSDDQEGLDPEYYDN